MSQLKAHTIRAKISMGSYEVQYYTLLVIRLIYSDTDAQCFTQTSMCTKLEHSNISGTNNIVAICDPLVAMIYL